MIRFTKKIRHYCDTNIDNEYTFADEDVSIGEIVDKLGPLEDDAEKLGCPLEIITGIMLKRISEIYVNYGDGGGYNSPYGDICKASVDGLYDDENYLSNKSNWVIETNLCPVPLKDYKIAWWLKEDTSE